MISERKSKFYISKFALHISRVNISTYKKAQVRITWKTQSTSVETTNAYELRNGVAEIEAELTLEDIFKVEDGRHLSIPKQSTIIVSFDDQNKSTKVGVCTLELSQLSNRKDLNTIKNYPLKECEYSPASINFALFHLSNFEIDQSQAISFASIIRKNSGNIDDIGNCEDQVKANSLENLGFKLKRTHSVQYEEHQQDSLSLALSNSDAGHNKKYSKKQRNSKDNIKTITIKEFDSQIQFQKIIQEKDKTIRQQKIIIQSLKEQKRILQQKCSTLEQKLKEILIQNKHFLELKSITGNMRNPDNIELVMKDQFKQSEPFAQLSSHKLPNQLHLVKSYKIKKSTKKIKQCQELHLSRAIKNQSEEDISLRNGKTQKLNRQPSRNIKQTQLQKGSKMQQSRQKSIQQYFEDPLKIPQKDSYELLKQENELNQIKKAFQEYQKETQTVQEQLFKQKKINILLTQNIQTLENQIKRINEQKDKIEKVNLHHFSQIQNKQIPPQVLENQKRILKQNNQLQKYVNQLRNKITQFQKIMPEKVNQSIQTDQNQKIKIEITESSKEDITKVDYDKALAQKQLQVTNLSDRLALFTTQKNSLEKKLETLTEALAKQKEKGAVNEKKVNTYDRIEKKLNEIQKFNKQLQIDYEKCDQDRKQKSNQITYLKVQLQQRQLQWKKLKRIEVQHKSLQEQRALLNVIGQRRKKQIDQLERKASKQPKLSSDKEELSKSRSEQILKLQAEKSILKDQTIRLNSKITELDKQIGNSDHTKDSIGLLQLQKNQTKNRLNDIEPKIKELEMKIQQKKKGEQENKNNFQYSDNRFKLLQQENQEFRRFTIELTNKLLEMQKLLYQRQDKTAIFSLAKKKQKELKELQQAINQELERIIDQDLFKEKVAITKPQFKQYTDRIRDAYNRKINFFKKAIQQYQTRQNQLYQRQKDFTLREVKSDTKSQIKKMLQIFDISGPQLAELATLRDKCKRLEELQGQNKQLKQKMQKSANDLKNSMIRKTQYDEALVEELKKRDKDNRTRLHAFELQMQKIKFQSQNSKTNYESSIKQLKRQCETIKQTLDKQKIKHNDEIKAIIEDYKLKQLDMKKLINDYQDTNRMLQRQLLKRDEDLTDQTKRLNSCIKQIQEIRTKYNDKADFANQMANKVKGQDAQMKSLMEIVDYLQNDKVQISKQLQTLRTQSHILFQEFKIKYEELDQNSREQAILLQEQIQRLRRLIQDQVEKSLAQDEENRRLQNQIYTYKQSIQQLYEAQLHNESAMQELREQYKIQQMQQKVVEDEYKKLLEEFGNKVNELNELKNKYVSLQILFARSEQFIAKLQATAEKDRQQFQQIFNEMEGQKNVLDEQIHELSRVASKKEREYAQNTQLFTDRQAQLKLIVEEFKFKFEQQVTRTNDLRTNIDELRSQNANLKQQVEMMKQVRKDIERRRGKRYYADPKVKLQQKDDSLRRKDSGDTNQIPKKQTENQLDIDEYEGEESRFQPKSACSPSYKHRESKNKQLVKGVGSLRDDNYPQTNPRIVSEEFNLQKQQICAKPDVGQQSFPNNGVPQLIVTDLQTIEQSKRLSARKQYHQRQDLVQSQQHNESMRDQYYEQMNEKVDQLEKELFQKKSMIADLERDYAKLKQETNRQVDKQKKLELIQQNLQASFVLQRGLNQQILEYKCKINELQKQLQKQRQQNRKYIESIKEIHIQYQQLEQKIQYEEQTIKQLQEELAESHEKQLESIQRQKQTLEVIKQKQHYFAEFEQLILNFNKEKQSLQNMLRDLQAQIDSKIQIEQKSKENIELLKENIDCCNNKIKQLSLNKAQLQYKLQSVIVQYDACKQQNQIKLSALQSETKQLKIQVKSKNQSLNDIAERYVQLENDLQTTIAEYKKLQLKLQEKGHKYQEALMKISGLEKEVNLGVLSRKDIEKRLSNLSKEAKKKQQQRDNIVNDFLVSLKRMDQEKQKLNCIISEKDIIISQKDIENFALKKDIQIFNLQTKKMKKQNDDYIRQIQVCQEQITEILKRHATEISQANKQIANYKEQIPQFHKVINEHQTTVKQLQKIDWIRQNMFHQLERKYQILQNEAKDQQNKILSQFNQKLAAAIHELNNKHQYNMQIKTEQLQFFMQLNQEQRSEIETQRSKAFEYECELEKFKHFYFHQKKSFQKKLQNYEFHMSELAEQIRQMEEQNKISSAQLYEELIFQNQMLRGRIIQLEKNICFVKPQAQEHFEHFKAKANRQRNEFLRELENYSNKVNELEEKNYELMKSIELLKSQDTGRNQELEKQNSRLENEILKLQHSQEELKRQLKVIRLRREQDMKNHLSQLQALRQC